MKNYDVKSSALELTIKSRITVQGKRLAYLVPNMFNKKSMIQNRVKQNELRQDFSCLFVII